MTSFNQRDPSSDRPRGRPGAAWLLVALASSPCYLALARGGPLAGPGVARYLVFYSLAFLLYFVALVLLFRRSACAEHACQTESGAAAGLQPCRLPSLAVVWSAALVFRLLLLLSPPTLSDDVYRYIWDGHVALNGVNPFAYAVNSPALDGLATPTRRLVNNRWMASPYLPAAQFVFAAVTGLKPESPTAFQIVMVGFDMLVGWLLMAMLRRIGRPPALALAYLWNPLVVIEFGHSAHVDAIMVALTLGSLAALLAGRRTSSALLLALATLTKGLPALLLFAIWPRWRARDWLTYCAVVAGLALPFTIGPGFGLFGPRDGVGLFGAIRLYGYQWNYNGGLYHWLEGLTTGIKSPGALPPETPGVLTAKLIAAGALGCALLWTARRARSTHDALGLVRLSLAPFAVYLLLTTTVHPWYVTWIVPLIVFELAGRFSTRDAQRAAYNTQLWAPLVYWSWSVGLSYLTYLDPSGLRETDAVRQFEYIPLFLVLLAACSLAVLRRPPTGATGLPATN